MLASRIALGDDRSRFWPRPGSRSGFKRRQVEALKLLDTHKTPRAHAQPSPHRSGDSPGDTPARSARWRPTITRCRRVPSRLPTAPPAVRHPPTRARARTPSRCIPVRHPADRASTRPTAFHSNEYHRHRQLHGYPPHPPHAKSHTRSSNSTPTHHVPRARNPRRQ